MIDFVKFQHQIWSLPLWPARKKCRRVIAIATNNGNNNMATETGNNYRKSHKVVWPNSSPQFLMMQKPSWGLCAPSAK